jgi:prepilin-type N-terminal cleavage/methylation domain-containing protein
MKKTTPPWAPLSPRPRHNPRQIPPAFTLIELLVVIGIIAVLVALLIPVVGKVRRAANGAATSAQLSSIAVAIQAYYGDFRAYPGPLPNNQLGISYYPSANYAASPNSSFVFVLDPNSAAPTTPIQLTWVNSAASGTTPTTFTQIQNITGAENLVLGLLGGLELQFTPNSSPPTVQYFDYNITNIFPDGTTPSPKGAMNLNPNNPKRFGAYLQAKPGDISNSQAAGVPTMFTDAALRVANDSPIPEFLDKYSQQMPILYMRANVGGIAIAGVGGGLTPNQTTPLEDSNNAPVIPQYDLSQVMGYTVAPATATAGAIGTVATDSTRNHHGLQGLGAADLSDTIQSGWANPTNPGYNGLAYLKDPSNPGGSNTPNYAVSPPTMGHARQKDGFILISAGPDGVYGTADDIIYPGSLNP